MPTDSLATEKTRVLIVRGDLNSYSGYARTIQLYFEWLEPNFDVILGVDLHAHPSRHASVWPYPLISDDQIQSAIRADGAEVLVLTLTTPDNFRRFNSARNIGFFFWETNRLGHPEWVAAMNQIDEVWVAAPFMRPMLEKEGVVVPVVYTPIPMPEPVEAPHETVIPELLLREAPLRGAAVSGFVSFAELRKSSDLLLLSTNTFIPRKGFPVLADEWMGVVRSHPGAALILKTSSIDVTETNDRLLERIAALFAQVGRRHSLEMSRVYLCVEALAPETMRALGLACDGFVTLSYGEGLGHGVFENLLIGKPALCLRHTSFADLLPPDYPYFIDTEVANVGLSDPAGIYPISAHWGVPREGALLETVETLITDLKEQRAGAVVAAAASHFRRIYSRRVWEHRS